MKEVQLFALVSGRTNAQKGWTGLAGAEGQERQSSLVLAGGSRDLSTTPEPLPGLSVGNFLGIEHM